MWRTSQSTAGGGIDTLDYTGTTSAVTVNLGTPSAPGFTSVAEIENVTGGSGNNSLTGDAGVNVLTGDGGDDTLDGAGGADIMVGGIGNDALHRRQRRRRDDGER